MDLSPLAATRQAAQTPPPKTNSSTRTSELLADALSSFPRVHAAEADAIQWMRGIVRHRRFLRLDLLHRGRQLERELAFGLRDSGHHIEKRGVADPKVSDESARAILQLGQDRWSIEIDRDDGRHRRRNALDLLEFLVPRPKAEITLVKARAERVGRMQGLKRGVGA